LNGDSFSRLKFSWAAISLDNGQESCDKASGRADAFVVRNSAAGGADGGECGIHSARGEIREGLGVD